MPKYVIEVEDGSVQQLGLDAAAESANGELPEDATPWTADTYLAARVNDLLMSYAQTTGVLDRQSADKIDAFISAAKTAGVDGADDIAALISKTPLTKGGAGLTAALAADAKV